MFYVIGQYWDFLLAAVLAGVAIGWWSEGRKPVAAGDTGTEAKP